MINTLQFSRAYIPAISLPTREGALEAAEVVTRIALSPIAKMVNHTLFVISTVGVLSSSVFGFIVGIKITIAVFIAFLFLKHLFSSIFTYAVECTTPHIFMVLAGLNGFSNGVSLLYTHTPLLLAVQCLNVKVIHALLSC